DFPGCGGGPFVGGSTAEIDLGPTTDVVDITDPTTVVGAALRATGHGTDTVDFEWSMAPLPGSDEHYVILRSDALPQGPFSEQATTLAQSWTDPAAPPRWEPPHVWYYDVRLADECG